jgi:hypothetical protein
MKKLYTREFDCCFGCPNHEVDEGLEVSGRCKALPNSVGIPLDFNSFENILDDCPLPDVDTITETMGNPNPLLTEEEERVLVKTWDQVNRQDRDLTSWQKSVSRVLSKKRLPKHCRSSENPSV